MSVEPPAIVHLGDRAFLARFADEAGARSWGAGVSSRKLAGVVDVVVAYATVAVFADPERADLDALEGELRGVVAGATAAEPSALHVIPTLYDGADLAEVAARLQTNLDGIIGLHSGREYIIQAIGFLPGFPYAGDLPNALRGLPRRASPRPRVPAGSVAIAGRQTAIYPRESPGGWHLLGRTPLRIVDLEAGIFPLRTGDRLRFVPIDAADFDALRERDRLVGPVERP